MLLVLSCQCGSSDSLIRGFLKSVNYEHWLDVPIIKGKAASKNALLPLPPFSEVEMLQTFLDGASKWAVVLGWDENSCQWADIAHNGAKSRIRAEFVVKEFA